MKDILTTAPDTLFVTGTGTDVGKSYATGWLARKMLEAGINVITQKLIQTGNHDMSEDIEVHRRLMQIPLQPRDIDHTTAPIILSYPASPHLAMRIDDTTVDYNIATAATATLLDEYDKVIIEGAGGLMVPLTEEILTIDYISDNRLPVVVVINGALGAINHAILTLRELAHENIPVWGVIYNTHFDSDTLISTENREYMRRYVERHHPGTHYLVME